MSASTVDGSTPSDRDSVALVVLAAGAGTRMKSTLPKPLHQVAGMPMVWHVLKAGRAANPVISVVVLSPAIASHPAWLTSAIEAEVVIQDPPLGTADAVSTALEIIPDVDWLLVLFADHPVLTEDPVRRLINRARASNALATILTCVVPEAGAYARIDRDDLGRLMRIVERKDDDLAMRSGQIEINSGMMAIDARWARTALRRIPKSQVTQEFYLPELVRIAVDERAHDEPWPVQSVSGDLEDLLGINDRIEQSQADDILRRRIRRSHMLNGVTFVMPETISIDEDVVIGADTTLLPFTVLQSGTRIGSHCTIGPHAVISRSTLGDHVVVRSSTISDSILESGSDAGPYAHLRNNARLGPDVHVGSYAEIKNSSLSEGARVGHFGYLGDAEIGARTNIGAGTVTCNFDGVSKHRTVIGEDAFVGSDTMLVAPVTIGDKGRTGAGAVVTKNVQPGETVYGVPARARAQSNDPDLTGSSVATTKNEGKD